MYHLVYISHAVRPMLESDLEQILSKSRVKNTTNQITGMLVYLKEKFIQVLEGDYEMVNEAYRHIKKDARHHKVRIMLEGNSEDRLFKNWSMGFKRLDTQPFEELSGFRDLEDFFDEQNVTDESPAVMIFLTLFYKKNLTDYPESASFIP
ncbi:MAG: hypothetical protein RI909_338 [Bacteroidota bacterium]